MSQPSSFDQMSGPRKDIVNVLPFDISVSFTEKRSEREVDQWLDELSAEAPSTRSRRRIGRQGRDSNNDGSGLLPALPGTTADVARDSWGSDTFEECLMLRKQHREGRHVANSLGALLKGVETKAEDGESLRVVEASLSEQSLVLLEGLAFSRQMSDEDVAVGAADTESDVFSARWQALGQAEVAAPGATRASARTMVDEVVRHNKCLRNQERANAPAHHGAASRPRKRPTQPVLRPAVPTQQWQTVRQRLQDGGRQFLAGFTRGPRDISDSSRVRKMAGVVPGAVSEIRGSPSAGPSQPVMAWDTAPMSLATSITRDTSVAAKSAAGCQRDKRGSGVAAYLSQAANRSFVFSNLSFGRDRDGFADSADIDPNTLLNDLLGAPWIN